MASSPPNPGPSKAAVFLRRTASTLLLWGLVAVAFASMQAWAYLLIIGILTVIATVEFFQMARAANLPAFARFAILLTLGYCGALYGHFYRGGVTEPAGLDALAIAIAIAGAFTLQLRHPIRGQDPLVAVAATVAGFVYIPFLFNFAAKLVFTLPGEGEVPGAFVLLWLVAVTKFSDMGAYLTGSAVGRHKMIPHVSPGKTWEGFAGALLFAQLAACGLFATFPTQLAVLGGWNHVITLGFLLAVLAVIGDLAESIVKRSLGAKDSGRMLPGIGGSLDLIDSICFTAPALYFYLKWILPALA
jgi:phosphatidate cytidylyltransferase